MKKKIKTIKDLPKWFSLDKYEGAKKLDAAGWYEQLIIREALQSSAPTLYCFLSFLSASEKEKLKLAENYIKMQSKHTAAYFLLDNCLVYANYRIGTSGYELDNFELTRLKKKLEGWSFTKNRKKCDGVHKKILFKEDIEFLDSIMGNDLSFAVEHQEIIKILRSNPIMDINSLPNLFQESYDFRKLKYIKRNETDIVPAVHLMTKFEFLQIKTEIQQKKYKKHELYELEDYVSPEDPLLPQDHTLYALLKMAQVDQPIQPHDSLNPFKALSVDITLPISLLLNQFKQIIQKLRQDYEISCQKEFTENDIQKFHSYHILPYLDLKFLAQQEGISITDQEMLDTQFFPNIGLDNFRKTTVKFAKKLMNKAELSLLAAQAAFELTEKK